MRASDFNDILESMSFSARKFDKEKGYYYPVTGDQPKYEPDFYKRDCQLKMLDPVGTVVELWDIKGAFITSANFQSLDYSGDEIMMIDLTLKFDNCVLQY